MPLRTRTRAPAAPRQALAPPESHVGESRSRGATGPCHVTEVPPWYWDGAGRGDALVAAAEASSRAGPAGEESAGGVAGGALGRPGLQVRPGLIETSSLGSPGLPRAGTGNGRDVGCPAHFFPWRAEEAEAFGATSAPLLGGAPRGAFRADLGPVMVGPGWGRPVSSQARPASRDPVTLGWRAKAPA